MAATCGATFAKVMLVIFNFLFLSAGLVLIAVGIWIIADPVILRPLQLVAVNNTFNSSLLRSSAILLITMGAFVVVVTIFGLVATFKESVILLGIYIALLIIVCCGEIAGGVIAIVYKDKIIQTIDTTLNNTLAGTYSTTTKPLFYSYDNNTKKCSSKDNAALWDYVQTKLQCCGVESPSDYNYFAYNITSICPGLKSNITMPNVPMSCCTYDMSTSPEKLDFTDQLSIQGQFPCPKISPTGCATQVTLFVQKYAPALIGIGIGFGMLELFGIIFAVCLCQNPGKEL